MNNFAEVENLSEQDILYLYKDIATEGNENYSISKWCMCYYSSCSGDPNLFVGNEAAFINRVTSMSATDSQGCWHDCGSTWRNANVSCGYVYGYNCNFYNRVIASRSCQTACSRFGFGCGHGNQ